MKYLEWKCYIAYVKAPGFLTSSQKYLSHNDEKLCKMILSNYFTLSTQRLAWDCPRNKSVFSGKPRMLKDVNTMIALTLFELIVRLADGHALK